jgi:hypothetical protein
MATCEKHPGRKADTSTSIGNFCSKCAEQIKQVQSMVDRHVSPKDCFVVYGGNAKGWELPEGTGCAHWVAHELSIKNGYSCAKGYTLRVPDLVAGARKIDRTKEDVKTGDIWAVKYRGQQYDHCGLVIKVEEIKGKDDKVEQKILIRHCTNGQGGVVSNDFATYLKGLGDFYRR